MMLATLQEHLFTPATITRKSTNRTSRSQRTIQSFFIRPKAYITTGDK